MKKLLSMFLCVMFIFTLIPLNNVAAYTTPIISMDNHVARQGDSVKVTVSIENNPGILAMAFCITYNSDAFEYAGYESGYLTNYNIKNHADKGWVSFVSVEESNKNDNGTMLTILFNVKEEAELGTYEIGIANNNPDKYGESLHNSFTNSKEQFIIPTVNKGSIQVVDGSINIVNGDVNGDGRINGRDYALLIQYINSWNVAIVKDASDVNKDGRINGRDYALLLQYLNNWDVEI